MTAEIVLVRHGQTESNRTGFYMGWSAEDLNAGGLAQAQRLSTRLAGLEIDAAFSSPLKRALHTAEIVAGPHQVAVNTLEGLMEINQGRLEGAHRSQTEKNWPDLFQHLINDPSRAVFPEGESFSQVADRTVTAFEFVQRQNPEKRVLLVAHEINIKIIIMHALGIPYTVYRRFEIRNASLSRLQFREGAFRLITLNDTAHLEQPS
ncbi:MAG: histidine phosphatase family protein [Dehalococcoidales bacterium]|nr:histidine phosphatase family protein [Dehalococcoidales bacterium]